MNFVSELAHVVLKLRGQEEHCTVDQLASAYAKAEEITESCLRLIDRTKRRINGSAHE